jgi:uncharacterized protein DUF4190
MSQPPDLPPPPGGGGPPGLPPGHWTPGPGGPVYVVQQSPKTNGLAVASMVLGILGAYLITAILALVFGYKAKRQIDASEGRQGGRGMAIAGIVLGWVMLPLSIANLVWIVYFFTRFSRGDFPFLFPTPT